MADARKCD